MCIWQGSVWHRLHVEVKGQLCKSEFSPITMTPRRCPQVWWQAPTSPELPYKHSWIFVIFKNNNTNFLITGFRSLNKFHDGVCLWKSISLSSGILEAPQLFPCVPASVLLIHGNPLGNLRTTNALTSWSWLDAYIIKTRFCQVIWGVSMSLDDSVTQYNVRTTGLRLVTFWSHWREDVIHAPVESQAGWTRRWTTRRSIGGDPALPSLGITSEPVPLDKNGWYWKPSQHLGASEVTDLRKEATITTLLDEHVLAHPKSYP